MRSTLARAMMILAAAATGLTGCGDEEAPRDAATRPAMTPSPAAGALDADHLKIVQADINRGLAYLLTNRNADGGWGFVPGASHAGLTAMAVKALLQHPDYDFQSPEVVKAFEVVMKVRPADDPEAWGRASSTRSVRADRPPFLLIHGSYDTLVEDE